MREISGAKKLILSRMLTGDRLLARINGNSRLGQGNVYSSSVKDRSDGDEDNLIHEAAKRERIVVENQATRISSNLNHATKDHEGHEIPLSPTNSKKGVTEDRDGVEGDEDGICGNGWTILVDAPFHGAEIECAVGLRAKHDESAWCPRKSCGWCRHGGWNSS